ncbi:hypothetical protein T484DRAFT_1904728 [Baffinella frigidus]|nr:hypothetical protein T484DRAFT_1904728 [Cryptophyta sp. CCMP2293]
MPWRDLIFAGDGIILPPCTQSFATGGIVLPPSISKEERVLLDLLAQPKKNFQAKPRSIATATPKANNDALSTATTPSISRCGSYEMDTSDSQSRPSSADQELCILHDAAPKSPAALASLPPTGKPVDVSA